MPSTEVTLTNEVGLHARPAAVFAKAAAAYAADVRLGKADREVNAKSLLSVLTLDVQAGDTVRIVTEGDDADAALTALAELARGL